MPVPCSLRRQVSLTACVLLGCVGAYVAILMMPTLRTCCGPGRARLGRREGSLLIGAYVLAVAVYGLVGGLRSWAPPGGWG